MALSLQYCGWVQSRDSAEQVWVTEVERKAGGEEQVHPSFFLSS